ncbi:MAG: outer membrane protein transport protein [Chitinophaga sp.]|uniref:OmpP1/FadL family transporter n=1 Tax=Chitinophaga sp. TaxID=1869181 RepID=UPI0025B891B8|nr:hypothetical protein [Chitinophaga sp.]MBV8253425.1 outer membrane protein transport protein [Chitinophaga sp.]
MIKSIYPLLGGLLLTVSAMAQSAPDALMISNQQPSGTARTQALGGVSVGLGGDFSSAFSNPAGIGIFKTGEFLISGGVGISSNTTSYLPKADPLDIKGSRTNFQVPNIGVVIAANRATGPNSWNNFSFAVGANRQANFNNRINIGGVTSTTSYTENWIDQLWSAGFNPMDPTYTPTGAGLAFKQGLIHSYVNSKGETDLLSEASPVRQTGGLASIYQRAALDTKGGLTDYTIAFGGNYGDRFYIGAGLVVPSINYQETLSVSEDDNTGNPNNNFKYFDYNQYTKISGLGIAANIGILYKITDRFRIGANFRTPTKYSMNITQGGDLASDTEGWGGKKYNTAADYSLLKDYSYDLTAPLRLSGGASYFFGNLKDPDAVTGFIAADYEYVNHSKSKYNFADDKAGSRSVNDAIGFLYKSASNFKVGAEVKFARIFAVRGGFAQFGNPYSNDTYNMSVDASRRTYSGGVGVRTKGIYVDLTYSYTQGKDFYQLYTTDIADYYPPAAMVDFKRSNIMATVGFKF